MGKTYNYYSNAYNKKYSKEYNSAINTYNNIANSYSKYVSSPSTPSISYTPNFSRELGDTYSRYLQSYGANHNSSGIEEERSGLDRALSWVGTSQYAVMGALQGIFDDSFTPLEGFARGLTAGNPFGETKRDYRYDFSGVLGSMGWQPETNLGRFAKGAIGFAGDILLDPMTYVSGGGSALLKGSGKASVNTALKGVDKLGDSARFVDSLNDIKNAGKMTREVAEGIVKNSKIVKSGAVTVDVAEESVKLAERYNKLFGVTAKVDDKTLSLANMPFGKKIFGKHADKSITLISSDAMRAIGDKTLAPGYAKLRDSIYGGKVGKLFAPTHPMYQIAKTNPEEVFNMIKDSDFKVGNTVNKNARDEIIRKNANILGNLDPSSQKKVIEALQDDKVMRQLGKTNNFIDTEEAIHIKEKIKFSQDEAVNRLNKLKGDKVARQGTIEVASKNIYDLNLEKTSATQEYISELLDIDVKYLNKIEEVDEYIDILKSKQVTGNIIKPERFFDKVNDVNLDVEDLSEFVFGSRHLIDKNVNPDDLQKVFDLVASGEDVKYVADFIKENRHLYNGSIDMVDNFVKQHVGYNDWDLHYTKNVENLYGILDRANTPEKALDITREIAGLEKSRIKKDLLYSELAGKSYNEIQDYIVAFNDNINTRSLDDIVEDLYTSFTSSDKLLDDGYSIETYLSNATKGSTRLKREVQEQSYEYFAKKLYGGSQNVTTVKKHNTINRLIEATEKTARDGNISLNKMKGQNIEVFLEGIYKKNVKEIGGKTTTLSKEHQKILDDINKVNKNKRLNELSELAKKRRREAINLDELLDRSKLYSDFTNQQYNLQKSISSLYDEVFTNKSIEMSTNKEKLLNVTTDIDNKLRQYTDEIEELTSYKATEEAQNIANLEKIIIGYDDLVKNASAFENYARYASGFGSENVDKVMDKMSAMSNYILRSDLGYSEREANVILLLRDEFINIAKDEIAIGKLDAEQLEHMMFKYLPHVLTDAGEEMFANKNFEKVFENFNLEFGFGREYNNFAKSRTIKSLPDGKGGFINEPTIEQINDFFRPYVKGKNVFSEDLADIYLTRAMKSSDLVYDDKYMRNMVDLFGEDYAGVPKEGYKVVSNYGMFKENVSKMVRLKTDLDLSDELTEYLKDTDVNLEITELAKKIFSESKPRIKDFDYDDATDMAYEQIIDRFFKETITEDYRRKLFTSNLEGYMSYTGTSGMLDEVALPMTEISDDIIHTMNEYREEITYRMENKVITSTKDLLLDLPHDLTMEGIKEQLIVGNVGVSRSKAKKVERALKRIEKLETIPTLQFKQVNDAIVDKANSARKLQIIKDNNDFLKVYDKFTHIIKLNQTTVLPSFHMRNKLSDTFNSFMTIGSDALDIKFQKFTAGVMAGKNVEEAFEITTATGKKIQTTWGEVLQKAIDLDVVDSGMFAKDIGSGSNVKGIFDGVISGKYDPTNTQDFILYKKGAEIGSKIEGHDRFIHFASEVKNGKTFAQAKESVDKALFDYGDLTPFEQGVMKRIIPYYTYVRKNSPYQLEMLLENPNIYRNISKVIGGVENMVSDEDKIDKRYVNDFAKDWVQTPFNVTNPDGRKETVLWNTNLPFTGLSNIPNPFNPLGTLESAFSMTNPIIKIPIELAMNRNTHFDQPIYDEADNHFTRQAKRLDHSLSQASLYTTAKGAVQKSGIDLGLHLMNATSGIKLLSYDYEKYKGMRIKEMMEKKEKSKLGENKFFK